MNTIDLMKFNLRNDVIFKYVFATDNSQDILIDLLNAVFLDSGQENITEITYLNPMNLKEYLSDKATVIDIKAKDGNGRLYNIEMQVQSEQHFVERIIYYNSKLLTGQLSEAQGYDMLNKTISIVFTNFILLKNEKGIHNIFRLLNVKSHKELADLVEYHFIELPKYRDDKMYEDPINHWLSALVNGETFMGDPARIPDAIKKEVMIMKAIEKMQKATSDEDVRAILEYREKAVRDEADRMAYATKKALMRGKEEGIMIGKEEGMMIGKEEGIMIGKEEGIMIGKEEGMMIGKEEGIMIGEERGEKRGEKRGKELERIAIAVQMLSHSISVDTISAVTGLSKEDILKLKQ